MYRYTSTEELAPSFDIKRRSRSMDYRISATLFIAMLIAVGLFGPFGGRGNDRWQM
jgi:hypothetical protein